jgi:hypothetical protein
MRRVLASLVLGASLAVIGAGSAFAGPQPLPSAACNSGTANAHAVGAQGSESIAHLHDFDGDEIWACYHINPTVGGIPAGLE